MKIERVLDAVSQPASEIINAVGYKTGVASISTTVGIVTSIEVGIIELVGSWGMTDTALLISMTSGVMFCLKLRMDMKKSALEMELMKKKAEKDNN